jgi:tetratricopeptide (TPR) repeat protein
LGPAALALIVALGAGGAGPPAARDPLAEAEALYRRRAEGARGGIGDPARVETAISAYRLALAADPGSLPARVGLMRALFFRGGFCGEPATAQKATFEEAKKIAQDAMQSVDERLRGLSEQGRMTALASVPEAAALHFWAGVSWGQWSLDHKMAAALHGAAGRIRDYAEVAIALDPAYEEGSPYLLLGRLHADSPRVPFVTGFISRSRALENLRRALAISPLNTATEYYLADAILDFEPQNRAEAIRLLSACAAQEARPDFLVEDAHYAELARGRLAQLVPAH